MRNILQVMRRACLGKIVTTTFHQKIKYHRKVRQTRLLPKKEKKRLRSPSSENSTPIKKGKKRVRNSKQWKKIKAKLLKNLGKSYISRTGKVVNGRTMGPTCGNRCILKCSEKFSEERRSEFFQQYWSLGSLQRQRDYLSSCIE